MPAPIGLAAQREGEGLGRTQVETLTGPPFRPKFWCSSSIRARPLPSSRSRSRCRCKHVQRGRVAYGHALGPYGRPAGDRLELAITRAPLSRPARRALLPKAGLESLADASSNASGQLTARAGFLAEVPSVVLEDLASPMSHNLDAELAPRGLAALATRRAALVVIVCCPPHSAYAVRGRSGDWRRRSSLRVSRNRRPTSPLAGDPSGSPASWCRSRSAASATRRESPRPPARARPPDRQTPAQGRLGAHRPR